MSLSKQLNEDMLKIITSEDIFNKVIEKFDIDDLPVIDNYIVKLHLARDKIEMKKLKKEFGLGKAVNDWIQLKVGDKIVHISYYSGRRVSFLQITKIIITKKYHDILDDYDDDGREVYYEPFSPRILNNDEITESRKTVFSTNNQYYYEFDFKYTVITNKKLLNYQSFYLHNNIGLNYEVCEVCDRKKYKSTISSGIIDKIYLLGFNIKIRKIQQAIYLPKVRKIQQAIYLPKVRKIQQAIYLPKVRKID